MPWKAERCCVAVSPKQLLLWGATWNESTLLVSDEFCYSTMDDVGCKSQQVRTPAQAQLTLMC